MLRLRRRSLIALAGAAPALLLGAGADAQLHYAFPLPVDIIAAGSPWPVMADGRLRLLYELRVTNFAIAGAGLRRMELTRLEVEGDGRPIAAFEQAALKGMLMPIGPPDPPGAPPEILAPGRAVLVMLDLALAPGAAAPTRLGHRLTVADPATGERLTVAGPMVAVVRAPPPLIGPPLRGAGWAALEALSNPGHRRAMSVRDGRTWIASRFAIDWARLGPDGRMFDGDPAQNASYHDWGAQALAVADGLVVEARDHASDNRGNRGPEQPLDLDGVAGNSVLLKLGPGRYAVYDHLKQGSARVRAGERVKAGQVLAEVGNSGSTIAPHLHFHLMDGPVHNGAQGIPYELRVFTDFGAAPALRALLAGEPWRASAAPVVRRHEFPLDRAVVSFEDRGSGRP